MTDPHTGQSSCVCDTDDGIGSVDFGRDCMVVNNYKGPSDSKGSWQTTSLSSFLFTTNANLRIIPRRQPELTVLLQKTMASMSDKSRGHHRPTKDEGVDVRQRPMASSSDKRRGHHCPGKGTSTGGQKNKHRPTKKYKRRKKHRQAKRPNSVICFSLMDEEQNNA